ncbi:hypothetical protein JFL43_22070 [Viridibacillus sp. YIM B01967]|uniref:Uncharacterized protein n=1 Tax=Viridibacillus soli TaxID=2798301 RepID=A0ABS1HDW3_9BACL|nr:hypothetical protein [Viridibacillus soli]MBK3497444.1 hypothetical protein [Viridibacillus soli]
MELSGWIFITIAVFYFPLFVWLSFAYIEPIQEPKRRQIYLGFLVSFGIFNVLNNILFKLNSSYGLSIFVGIIILFSIYMLLAVMKDKKIIEGS